MANHILQRFIMFLLHNQFTYSYCVDNVYSMSWQVNENEDIIPLFLMRMKNKYNPAWKKDKTSPKKN